MDKGFFLRYYKRKDIQEAMVEHARDKEIGVRYGESFGKRPDILNYPKEVIELAMQGATSFHCSEERWSNPSGLKSEINKKEMEELREGWDLVLDVDCSNWEFSKLTALLFIQALKDNEVKDISCKFSGNKGFHIGVPFEAFPQRIGAQETKKLFPEGPQKISHYLLDYIPKKYVQIRDNKIIFLGKYNFTLEDLKQKFGEKKFLLQKCAKCEKEVIFVELKEGYEFICPKCEERTRGSMMFKKCDRCNILMERKELKKPLCSCGSNQYKTIFNPYSIIEVDTILIAPRHLYRMPYSLHEKSGLASVVIEPEKVMGFEKEMAQPEKAKVSKEKFLDRGAKGESGGRLLLQALDFEVKKEEKDYREEFKGEMIKIEGAIKEEFFPPCMKLMLEGLGDGRKRAVFCLINFLGQIGWEEKEIKDFLLKWNKEKNKEPLRENLILGQLNHAKRDKLPPNCDNAGYYKDMGVCRPEKLCERIKNPVNYAILKWKGRLREKREEKEN